LKFLLSNLNNLSYNLLVFLKIKLCCSLEWKKIDSNFVLFVLGFIWDQMISLITFMTHLYLICHIFLVLFDLSEVIKVLFAILKFSKKFQFFFFQIFWDISEFKVIFLGFMPNHSHKANFLFSLKKIIFIKSDKSVSWQIWIYKHFKLLLIQS